MIANDGEYQSQRLQGTADVLSGYGMAFHHHPLLRGEVRAFLEDLVRDRDLAKVMQVAASAKGDDVILIEQEVPAQVAGIFRQTLAMSFSIRIPTFDAYTESTEHALSGFKFVGEFFQLDE